MGNSVDARSNYCIKFVHTHTHAYILCLDLSNRLKGMTAYVVLQLNLKTGTERHNKKWAPIIKIIITN